MHHVIHIGRYIEFYDDVCPHRDSSFWSAAPILGQSVMLKPSKDENNLVQSVVPSSTPASG
jgi:hypothetical protein